MDPTQALIEQYKHDIDALQDTIKQLESTQPKPRCGDIVRNRDGEIRIVAGDSARIDCTHTSYDSCGGVQSTHVSHLYGIGEYTVIGNAFDLAKGL